MPKHVALRELRGFASGPDGDLYVADRDADRVKRYDGARGSLQCEYQHNHLSTSVHLAFQLGDRLLLAGSRDQHAMFAINTDSGEVSPLVEPDAGGLQSPGGIAFDAERRLYVCSRQTRQILRYDGNSGAPDLEPFIDGLKDAPEFTAFVDV